MPHIDDTTQPIGNNVSDQLSVEPLSDTEKEMMVNCIMTAATVFWGVLKYSIVDIRLLDIDYSYQRILGNKVSTLTKNFDYRLMDPIIVSFRDNKLYIIDGQHRLIAAAAHGILQIPCIIHLDLTRADEAKMFAMQNSGKSKLTPYDLFKAHLQYGEPVDTTINNICKKYGITPSVKKSQYSFQAIHAARQVVKNTQVNGEECLDWIFNVFSKCRWFSFIGAVNSVSILGLQRTYVEGILHNDLDTRTENLIHIFGQNSWNDIRCFAGAKYAKEYRYNFIEACKDISTGIYTQTDIEALRLANEVSD